MADTVLKYAVEAERIGRELLETVDDHNDLNDATILYLFTSQTFKQHGTILLGKVQKPGALIRFFASGDHQSVEWGPDFILTFPETEWDALSDAKRRYLVDHELSHCYKKITVDRNGEESESWAIRSHDIQAFNAVVERHGPVMPEVKQFVRSATQLKLSAADAAQNLKDIVDDPESGIDSIKFSATDNKGEPIGEAELTSKTTVTA